MDSPHGLSPSRSRRYHIYVYAILIGIFSETLYFHYKATSLSEILKHHIDELNKQQELTSRKLTSVEQFGSNVQRSHMRMIRNIDKKVNFRVRRDVTRKSELSFRELKAFRLQLLRLRDEERRLMALLSNGLLKQELCQNATLVCKKGERGPRGKSGPRGYKGDIGNKGDRGTAGQQGPVGPSGSVGQKGQKGDPGKPGKSIEKPRILTPLPAQITKTQSSNLTLFCEASGNPPANIQWKFGKQTLNSRYTFPAKGGLVIADINKTQEGIIRCIAENILGKDVSETKLIVHTMPKVILPSNMLTVTEGIPFEVLCTANGDPFPTLKWKRGFKGLATRQVLSKEKKNLTLVIDTPSLADMGWYICLAENYIGRSEKAVLLRLFTHNDCSSIKVNRKSGIYTINPDDKQSFKVYCDMKTGSGGWIVIQRRTDGSVGFFRSWVDYKLGFGNVDNEFWLGNDKIHRLTKHRNMMIRFDLEDVNGNKAYAEYKSFYIDGENDNYRVHVSSYSGTAGDSFSNTNGIQFSTKDRDNDVYSDGSCAKIYYGGWWYEKCHQSNLNGRYLNGIHKSFADGVNWYHFKGYHNSLKHTEIKVKPAI